MQTQDFEEQCATQVINLDDVRAPMLQKTVKEGVDKNVWGHISQNKKNPQHEFPDEYNEGEEFTHLRYTPVCSPKPILFKNDYSLRASQMGRKVRHLITVTMYNEAWTEVRDTLTGICKGIQHMVDHSPGLDAAEVWQVSALDMLCGLWCTTHEQRCSTCAVACSGDRVRWARQGKRRNPQVHGERTWVVRREAHDAGRGT
jgi:hypothetical protein